MSRRQQQSGQALVAALVTMVLLFSLAGALAMAASAALAQQRGSEPPFQTDLDGQSVIQALAAAGTAQPQACPSGGLGQGRELGGYLCNRLPLVVPVSSGSAVLNWQSATCGVTPLAGSGHVTAWINALAGGQLYIDSNPTGCSGASGACASTAAGNLVYVRDCDLSTLGTPYAHVSGAQGPSVVRFASAASFVGAPGSPFGVSGQVSAVATGHFHVAKDGITDLAVAVQLAGGPESAAGIDVFRGAGDGSFRLCTQISADADQPRARLALAVADFNRDGVDDLAFTNPDSDDNTVSVYLGSTSSNCSFEPATGSPFALAAPCTAGQTCNPGALVAAPLRAGSSLPDLAVAGLATGTVSVLLNNGSGSFAPAVSYDVGGATAQPVAITAGYLAGDPAPDLAVADFGFSAVALLRNDGSGRFVEVGAGGGNLPALTFIPVFAAPTGIVAGQFDASAPTDLAVSTNASWIAVLLSNGNGSFAPAIHVNVGGPTAAIGTGDLAAHGLSDLVAVVAGSNAVLPLIASGGGSFTPAVGGALAGPSGGAAVAAATLAGDSSHQDIAVGGNGSVAILAHNRQSLFSVLAPDTTGSASMSEADFFVLGPAGTRLTYEGGL